MGLDIKQIIGDCWPCGSMRSSSSFWDAVE